MNAVEFRKMLKEEVGKIGTQREAAKKWGFSAGYINDVIKGRNDPSDRLAEALGYRKVVSYRKKEKQG